MMLETYVAQNFTGILHSTWPQADIYFWNIQGRHEVDFVIQSGKKCIAIEIKAAARWDSNFPLAPFACLYYDLTSKNNQIGAEYG